jgi:hypothetical protein
MKAGKRSSPADVVIRVETSGPFKAELVSAVRVRNESKPRTAITARNESATDSEPQKSDLFLARVFSGVAWGPSWDGERWEGSSAEVLIGIAKAYVQTCL